MKHKISTGALQHSRALSPETLGDAQNTHYTSHREVGAIKRAVDAHIHANPELRRTLGGKIPRNQRRNKST